jgi:hypothetical protein
LRSAETFGANCSRLVGAAVSEDATAPLSVADHLSIDEALERCLDLLDPSAHSLLHEPLLNALLRPAGAQLLALLLEALHGDGELVLGASIESILTRLLAECTCLAGMRCTVASFAAFGDDGALAIASAGGPIRDGAHSDGRRRL